MVKQVQDLQASATASDEETDHVICMDTAYSSAMSSGLGNVESLNGAKNYINKSTAMAVSRSKVGPLRFVGNFALPVEGLAA